jgi:hypothetical protein
MHALDYKYKIKTNKNSVQQKKTTTSASNLYTENTQHQIQSCQ